MLERLVAIPRISINYFWKSVHTLRLEKVFLFRKQTIISNRCPHSTRAHLSFHCMTSLQSTSSGCLKWSSQEFSGDLRLTFTVHWILNLIRCWLLCTHIYLVCLNLCPVYPRWGRWKSRLSWWGAVVLVCMHPWILTIYWLKMQSEFETKEKTLPIKLIVMHLLSTAAGTRESKRGNLLKSGWAMPPRLNMGIVWGQKVVLPHKTASLRKVWSSAGRGCASQQGSWQWCCRCQTVAGGKGKRITFCMAGEL